MNDALELKVSKTIPAPAKDIFEAWLDPKALARFMKPGPSMADADVEVDASVGGSFRIVMKAGDKQFAHEGTYQRIDKYRELVFTWISDFTMPGSTVTLTFREISPRETEVHLHHIGFPSPDLRDNHKQGWAEILDMSAALVS